MPRGKLALVLAGVALLAGAAAAPAALDSAEQWIPRQAVIVVQLRRPADVLGLLLRPELIRAVEASPAYKAQQDSDGFRELSGLVKAFEKRFRSDWKAIVRRLAGRGATWAIGPNRGQVLILDALDAEALGALHDMLVAMTGSAGEDGQGPPPTMVAGVETWSLGPREAHAILGTRMVLATGPNTLKTILEMRSAPRLRSIAAVPGYRQARRAAGADAAVFAYANSGVLKNIPPVAAALSGGKNPLAALLAAPLLEAVGRSNWLALGLKVRGTDLTIEALTDGTIDPNGAARFAQPASASDGALAHLRVPRRLAAASFHRDLAGFYAAKDQLFPERTSGLIFFENMMGIFFTGRDLTEEVLAETGPKMRLVVARQEYDPAVGTPAPQLPAFALVMQLKHPEDFRLVVEEAWQKALGLINFTRGQQAQPGLIIDRPVHRGTKYTVATFIPPREAPAGPVDGRYNFRPALAMPGNHLILSSTDALAEDIMDALAAEDAQGPRPLPGTHSAVEIDGASVAALLEANREALIRQNMVEKGNTHEQAAGEVGVLLGLVRLVSHVELTVGTRAGRTRAALTVGLNLPPAGKGAR